MVPEVILVDKWYVAPIAPGMETTLAVLSPRIVSLEAAITKLTWETCFRWPIVV